MYNIKVGNKTLKVGNVEVNMKNINAFKQPITLNLVDRDKIVIPDKVKHSDKGFKYLIGYADDKIILLDLYALLYIK